MSLCSWRELVCVCLCVCVWVVWGGEVSNLLGQLLHAVKSAASLEPSNLQFVECMVELNLLDFVAVLDLTIDGLAGRQGVQVKQRNLARRLNLKIKYRICD